MKKISKIRVKSMQVLTSEQMAQIEGGEFTITECNESNYMKYCAIDFHDGGWVKVGICIAARSEKAEVTPTGFRYTYTYYCAPLES